MPTKRKPPRAGINAILAAEKPVANPRAPARYEPRDDGLDRLHIQQVKLDREGCAPDGTFWNTDCAPVNKPLFCVFNKSGGTRIYVRAYTVGEVRLILRTLMPKVWDRLYEER
jgi:hypothetical protein